VNASSAARPARPAARGRIDRDPHGPPRVGRPRYPAGADDDEVWIAGTHEAPHARYRPNRPP